MAVSDKPPRNGFVQAMRKIYNPIGFSKGYNAILGLIFNGAFLGFLLARVAYLSFYGVYCNPTYVGTQVGAGLGECYYQLGIDRYRIGIQIHLYTIIPAGFLAVMQFIPIIRYKALIVHRISGYLAILLVVISDAGALMIADRSFGGSASTRTYIGTLAVLSLVGFGLALYNVKKLQIDQHRKWMLRTWFYMAAIITLRIILAIAGAVTATWPSQQLHIGMECVKIVNIYETVGSTASAAFAAYPICDPSSGALYASGAGYAVVVARLTSPDPAQTAAALDGFFGMAGWLALALHAVGIEIYLRLTPAEHERLRQVSYEKQLERGWTDAGYSGLVVEKLGDVATKWQPAVKEPKHESSNESITFQPGRQPVLAK